MKKIIYSLITLSLISASAFTFTACNSDDSTPEPTPTPTPQLETLKISASETEVYVGATVTLTATLGNKDVTSEATFYKDEVIITGNTITSNEPGSFLIKAKYPNANDSEYITVTFSEDPFANIEGTGTLTYNGGSANNINKSYLSLQGFYYTDETETSIAGWWWQAGWDGNDLSTANNLIVVTFDVPATLVGEEVTDFLLPSDNQNSYYSILGLRIGGEDKVEDEYTAGSGVITYTALNTQEPPATADYSISVTGGTHNINFVYNGEILLVAGKSANNTVSFKKKDIKSYAQYKADKAAFTKSLLKK